MSTLITSPEGKKLLYSSRKAVSMEPMPATLGRALETNSIRLVSSCTRAKLSGDSCMNRMHSHGRQNSKNSLSACRAKICTQRALSASSRRLSVPSTSSCSSQSARRCCHFSVLGRKPSAQRARFCTSGDTHTSTSATITSATTAYAMGRYFSTPVVLAASHLCWSSSITVAYNSTVVLWNTYCRVIRPTPGPMSSPA